MCSSKIFCCIDPPAITAIIFEVCTNDFTISWTASNIEEGLSYTVTIFTLNGVGTTLNFVMDTSYNYTEPMPDTTYNVSVASRLISGCLGSPTTKMVTTLAVAEGIPAGELFICIFEISAIYVCTYVRIL